MTPSLSRGAKRLSLDPTDLSPTRPVSREWKFGRLGFDLQYLHVILFFLFVATSSNVMC